MNQDPIEVIGSGFVPGIPGIYGNTTIPAPAKEDDAAALDAIAPASPDPVPPPQKSSSSKSSPASKANPGA